MGLFVHLSQTTQRMAKRQLKAVEKNKVTSIHFKFLQTIGLIFIFYVSQKTELKGLDKEFHFNNMPVCSLHVTNDGGKVWRRTDNNWSLLPLGRKPLFSIKAHEMMLRAPPTRHIITDIFTTSTWQQHC